MNETSRTRFDEVWQLLTAPEVEQPKHINPASQTTLSVNDIYKLLECDIIARVDETTLEDNPTKGTVVPFSTVEDREERKRRRFICRPTEHNLSLREKYTPYVPITQPVHYVSALKNEEAVKRDLRCKFYQVELPESTRPFYRFVFQNRVYELKRMPMGHVCAPEIQQTITAVLAGDPSYCTSHSSNLRFGPGGDLDVYVDGFRFSGSSYACQEFEKWIEECASKIRATFKQSDSIRGTKYTFVGIDFDHQTQKYRLTARFIRKLPHILRHTMPLHELETLTARLVYGSGVLKINMPRYYWAIKFVRRKLSQLNRGKLNDTTEITLPISVYNDLHMWLNEVRANQWYEYRDHTGGTEAVLYTDASQAGWGAVLFTPFGKILGTGAPWPQPIEINRAEATAVYNAFHAFRAQWSAVDTVHLLIDNTSVVAAL